MCKFWLSYVSVTETLLNMSVETTTHWCFVLTELVREVSRTLPQLTMETVSEKLFHQKIR